LTLETVQTIATTNPWRVRFRSPGTFAEEFDNNLSNRGLFVPTETPCGVREIVEFVLVIPTHRKEIRGRGEVIYVIDPDEAARRGVNAGVGLHLVEFDMKSAAEARRVIGEALNQAALEAPEKRRSARVPARLHVRFERSADYVVGFTRDISRGGLFLCTDRVIPEGSPVNMTLLQTLHGAPLSLRGEVVHVASGGEPPTGMGVAFDCMGEEQREVAARLVSCLDLRRRSLSAQRMQGKVDGIGIENVIRVFCVSGREGELIVRHGEEAGRILFHGGQVVRADIPARGLVGEKAFFRIASWDRGDYEYHARAVEPEPPLGGSALELFAESRRARTLVDDWGCRLPANRTLLPGPSFNSNGLCVPEEALPLVELLDLKPSVGSVLDRLTVTDLDAYRLLESLRTCGVIRIV
jgi:type IV pilus assembly protein PilZ